MNLFTSYGSVLSKLFLGNLLLLYFIIYMINRSNSFIIPPNPLKQLLFSRAIVSSVTEQLDIDIMDRTVLFQQFIGNTNYQYLIVYILGLVLFDLRNINNQNNIMNETLSSDLKFDNLRDTENKLQNIEYYKKTKFRLKQFMFIVFCIFGNNIERVI